MWDADISDPSVVICSGSGKKKSKKVSKQENIQTNFYKFKVMTQSGKTCLFPFNYGGKTYSTCMINRPNNPTYLPECITTDGTSWDFCNGNRGLKTHF
jgi:hypothetical protein